MDRLERDLYGRAAFLRLNVHTDIGRELWQRYGVEAVPAFLVFDGEGAEVWRQEGRYPDRGAILERVAEALPQ